MSIQAALNWTIYLLGLSLCIQAFEMRSINRSCSPWSWTLLRGDFIKAPKIMTDFFDALFTKHFLKLIHTQIVLVLILVVFSDSAAYSPVVMSLIICCFLISLRFRGLFNGGSDSMTMVVLLGLLIPAIQPGKVNLIKTGLYYIAFQSTLSYFVSGIIKLKNKSWRRGLALQFFLNNPNYIVPESIRLISLRPLPCLLLSWLVILWECSFPWVWFNHSLTLFYLVTGAIFHFGNFLSLGLNRFFFAWLATYPALWFCIQNI